MLAKRYPETPRPERQGAAQPTMGEEPLPQELGAAFQVIFDGKINVIKDALGLHTYVSRVQGSKLKARTRSASPPCSRRPIPPFSR